MLWKFDISHNEFLCSCAQRWFVDFLRSSNISKILKDWPNFYVCVYPEDKKSILLVDYKPTDVECSKWSPVFTIVMVTVVSLFIVTLVLILIFSCNANIRNLIYFLRVNAWKRKGYFRFNVSESCEYNAFVIYCDSDRQWVHMELVRRIEEIDLKVCVHHRDFDIGEPITDNITKYVGKSWKVIVVMSNDFTKVNGVNENLTWYRKEGVAMGKTHLFL
ncbi:unnamed protein product [Mytilus coruscus]|uniref:TIR domain-containing protein n=1 Tax=Mytilus coruscus TaxID=42192 RepID=A0A6J8EGN2_MYTCO|nr:unnamed protein product [Mytilus coruscus]